jgi:phosphoribosyl 1,2-cyclic phosphate 1,2-diphosphodiesterase
LLCLLPKKPESLLELCRETLKRKNDATLEMITRLRSHYPLDAQTVKHYAPHSMALCKQHIMLALMDMGDALPVFGELYRTLFSPKNGWALVETHLPDTRDAIRLIKETGGAAILAHPGVYGNFDIIEELCRLSLDGIEVFHTRQSEADTARARAAADHFGLIRTGGSDFHGMIASRVNTLGAKQTEDGELNKLLSRFG